VGARGGDPSRWEAEFFYIKMACMFWYMPSGAWILNLIMCQPAREGGQLGVCITTVKLERIQHIILID